MFHCRIVSVEKKRVPTLGRQKGWVCPKKTLKCKISEDFSYRSTWRRWSQVLRRRLSRRPLQYPEDWRNSHQLQPQHSTWPAGGSAAPFSDLQRSANEISEERRLRIYATECIWHRKVDLPQIKRKRRAREANSERRQKDLKSAQTSKIEKRPHKH